MPEDDILATMEAAGLHPPGLVPGQVNQEVVIANGKPSSLLMEEGRGSLPAVAQEGGPGRDWKGEGKPLTRAGSMQLYPSSQPRASGGGRLAPLPKGTSMRAATFGGHLPPLPKMNNELSPRAQD